MAAPRFEDRKLCLLARSRRAKAALEELVALRLVQSPSPGRYAIHATVRYALQKTVRFDVDRYARHYLEFLEGDPARLRAEETHLFPLMAWAQERGEISTISRVQRLSEQLADVR